jgi:hypothetical protein
MCSEGLYNLNGVCSLDCPFSVQVNWPYASVLAFAPSNPTPHQRLYLLVIALGHNVRHARRKHPGVAPDRSDENRLRPDRRTSRISRRSACQATDARRSGEDGARDHLLHRSLHDPVRLDRMALGPMMRVSVPGAEHYREIADKLREAAGTCQFAGARKEILHLAARFESRADHLDHRARSMNGASSV